MKMWVEELKKQEKKSLPILSYPAVQLMNVSVKELTYSSELQAEGMRLIAERTNAAAAVSMMDLSVEAEAFGAETIVSDNEVPTVTGHLVDTYEDAEALKVPDVSAHRTNLYVEAISKARGKISKPILAGVIGPFSLSGRLMDVTEVMIKCYDDPDAVNLVLDKASQFIINYIESFKKAGANGVVVAEPLAGLLSPTLMEEFAAPYMKRIVDSVQTDDFIVVYHNCGNNTVLLSDYILSSGAAAYHFGNAIDMEAMLAKIPSEYLVMGNVDPVSGFRNGTPESMREAVFALLDKCRVYDNFVISSGCDIPPASKWENIDAFFKAVEDFVK